MSIRALIAPQRYIQGDKALDELGKQVKPLGQKPMVLSDSFVLQLLDARLAQIMAPFSGWQKEVFGGEASKDEVNRLAKRTREENCDVVIGIGGGKTLDTAKAVAYHLNLPVVIVPTIASTDAPTSALAVLYTPAGAFAEYLILPRNPNLVLVDTGIISQAPVRLLVSGMGDALSTRFEAEACAQSGARTLAGGASTRASISLARLCYEILLADGLKAKFSAERKVVTSALENVVEANTLLSGLGFESGGLAAAHAIHNGLTVLPETHNKYHGEKVAFGTLTQLVMENRSLEEIEEVLHFCISVGLPVTLEQIGVTDKSREHLMPAAEAACAKGETIFNMPFPVTPETVYGAMLTADALGQQWQQ